MRPKRSVLLGIFLCSVAALAAVDVDAEILKDLEFFQEMDLIQTESSESDDELNTSVGEARDAEIPVEAKK